MRLLRAIVAIFRGFTTAFLVVGSGVLIGIASAFYVIDNGTRLTVREHGPWRQWISAASSTADPYTRAHIARIGQLPLSAAFELQFHARADNDGSPLHSSCDYAVEADTLDAQWWSLAVFDEKGRLIKNEAERWSFNSATAARGSDGSLFVTLARSARPGNWLPTATAGRLTLVLSVLDQRWGQQSAEEQAKSLPSIRKVGC